MNLMVTWGELVLALVVMLAFYYVVALALLYRREWRALLRRRGSRSFAGVAGGVEEGDVVAVAGLAEKADKKEEVMKDRAPDVAPKHNKDLTHELMAELKRLTPAVTDAGMTKEAVVAALREMCARYGELRGDKLFDVVLLHIVSEVEQKFGYQLTAAEVRSLWDDGGQR